MKTEIKSREGIIFGRAAKSIQDFRKDLIPTNSASLTNSTDAKSGKQIEAKPVPVEVRDPETSPVQVIQNLLGPLVTRPNGRRIPSSRVIAMFCRSSC
jgi:hypothetical protein